ncbi:MAG: hypothetical protein V1692_00945 [bacterium]
MLDEQDIKLLKDVFTTREEMVEMFATKEDLKQFATREEMMETFATKEDLKNFATREEMVEMFATKDDLESFRNEAMVTFATKDDLDNFREEMKQMFSDLQTSVDAYAKLANAYLQEMVVLNHKVNRLEGWVQQIANKIGIQLEY